MSTFDDEIKIDFLTEAKELLSGTEQCFLSLEKNPSDLENLNLIFRLAHNLKGSSGAVGFTDLADFTHKLESLLLALKEARLAVTKSIVDLLLRTNDYLVQTIETLQGNLQASYVNPELTKELIEALDPNYGRGEMAETPTADAPVAEESVAAARTVDVQEPQPLITQSVPEASFRPSAPAANSNSHNKPKDENIRVSLSRIEKLLNNVGELSILQAVMVQQCIDFGSGMPQLMRDTLSAMTKIIKDTQSLSMGLRMLPIKQTFHKMERIVRDSSKALGKDVELHLSGEETEVDKTVLEQLADPLVHIIRNAVDHGLEDTESRQASGKSPVGHVYLSASHRAGQILIEIRDDGKGLDADKLVSKAKSKGILAPDANLTAEQAYQLIFAPGFSTKDQVTDLSGRGVGMDVVRTNITALQGSIEIETTSGKGTCFRIFLPLTLAIIDSIIVCLNSERYVIPLSQVSEFFKPQESDINHVYDRSELLTLREEPLLALRLSSLIGRSSVEAPTRPAWDFTALIIRDHSHRAFAILVDQIVSQQQVVIKPLGAEIKGKLGIMGSAILGDGKPALILDLFELTKSVGGMKNIKSQTKSNIKMEAA